MKKFISLLLAGQITLAASALAGAGTGPWASGAYYPGQLDGKYQAAVYGNNITGVVGFALTEGAPPFSERTSVAGDAAGAAAGAGAGAGAAAQVNVDLGLDETQNYFAIFAEGRTYTGRTVGMVDVDRKTVTGTMIGAQPTFDYGSITIGQAASLPAPPPDFFQIVESETEVPILNNLPLINRGLSGGFQAKLKTKNGGSVTTFKGHGQLSTPAQAQTVNAQPNTFAIPNIDPAQPPILITGFTPATLAASIETESVPFSVYGIKTSFLARNPILTTDASGAGAAP